MGSKIGNKRPVVSQRNRCVVGGCAEQVRGDTILCARHGLALWPGPTASPPESTLDQDEA